MPHGFSQLSQSTPLKKAPVLADQGRGEGTLDSGDAAGGFAIARHNSRDKTDDLPVWTIVNRNVT
jgi:hypothetical protein